MLKTDNLEMALGLLKNADRAIAEAASLIPEFWKENTDEPCDSLSTVCGFRLPNSIWDAKRKTSGAVSRVSLYLEEALKSTEDVTVFDKKLMKAFSI